MRFLALAAAAFLTAAGPVPTGPDPRTSLAHLAVKEEGEVVRFCSAAVVRLVPTPQLVTEAHCVDSVADLQVYADGIPVQELLRDHDFVLLLAEDRDPRWNPAHLAERDPEPGDMMRAFGWAYGEFPAVVRGVYSGRSKDEFFFDLNTIRGMSGGPIVDDRNHLVALVRGVQSDGTVNDPASPNGLTFTGNPAHLRELVRIGFEVK